MTIQLSGIYYFPIKSIAGIHKETSAVERYGLKSDRCMMLVDESGNFISQRKYPELALIKIHSKINEIILDASNGDCLSISADSFTQNKITVKIWGEICQGLVANNKANAWFSKFLKQNVYLVKYDFNNPRATDPSYSLKSDIVSFADGFPILMISESSLADLNQRLEEPVSMLNFRPNLVIKGCKAFAEDQWRTIKVGAVTFDLVKPCSRCVLTTINPETGVKHKQGQPLKMLSSYRRSADGVVFGMNLIPRTLGKICLGDKLEIIRK